MSGRTLLLGMALAAAGCTGGGTSAPALHQPFPQLPFQGGPVLAHPRTVTITFPGYPYRSQMEAYGAWVTTSSWLSTVGADYSVSTGTALPPVVLTSDAAPATASDTQTQSLLARRIGDGTLPAPSAADPVLYLLYYPAATVVSDFSGNPNCNGPLGGYHWETSVGGTKVPYAVLPTCSSDAQTLVYLETAASHELIEAATDPFPMTATGWGITDPASPWAMLDGEVADLCEMVSYAHVGSLWATRSWSNSAAAAGSDPCLPAPARTFYDTSAAPSSAQTVHAGGSATFSLTGWSTGPTAAWSLSTFTFGDFTPTVALSSTTLSPGGTASMTVTVPTGTASGSRAEVILLSAHDLASYDLNYWPVEVIAQ